jgi:hypothetical protein
VRERIERNDERLERVMSAPGRREHVILAMQRTHGNATVARAMQQLRRKENVDVPEIDQLTMGLTPEQAVAVGAWSGSIHVARNNMELHDWPGAMKPLNALDSEMRRFAQLIQGGNISAPAAVKLGTAAKANDETLLSVGALASKRRDNIREAWQHLRNAANGLQAAQSDDKLSDAEKGLLNSYGGQLSGHAGTLQTFEADTPTLRGVLESSQAMAGNLESMAEKSPALLAPAKLISDAGTILTAVINPAGAEHAATMSLAETEYNVNAALSLPRRDTGFPSQMPYKPMREPAQIHPEP